MMQSEVLINMKDVSVDYEVQGSGGILRKTYFRAVSDFDIEIRRGEAWAIVGESGSGKSTLAMAVMGLINVSKGSIMFNLTDKPISIASRKERRNRQSVWKKSSIVFQDPFSSIDPKMLVGDVILEPYLGHKLGKKSDATGKIKELIPLVGLKQEHLDYYPDQLSGGLRQRVAIARSLINDPDFIIFDEPTSSLDVSVQAQILNLIIDIRKGKDLTYLFITHNLLVARHISEKILVMYLGNIMEKGLTEEVFENPLHPYTKLLVSSIPLPEPGYKLEKPQINKVASVSDAGAPSGCVFHNRCPVATGYCGWTPPEVIEIMTNDLYKKTGSRELSCDFKTENSFSIINTDEHTSQAINEIISENVKLFKRVNYDENSTTIELYESWLPHNIKVSENREVRCVLYDKDFSEYKKIIKK